MTVRYAVTFEFETLPPVTARGVVTGSKVHTLAHRAVEDAWQQLKAPQGWSSFVCCVLERLPDAQRSDAVDEETGGTRADAPSSAGQEG